jgi:chromosome partitioning protein
VFAESAASGNTVFEVDKNGSAAKEVKALVNELLKLGV